jgi:serine/threonine-protein kinase
VKATSGERRAVSVREVLAQPIPFGKYQLVERLGRGGMAEVWKARMVGPAGFQRTLVVKRILPELAEDPQFVAMFVSEARLSARLNHVNIVHVFELGEAEGEYYLAMEYVHGHTLTAVMRNLALRGLPPPGFGAMVVRDLCRALAYAHALTDDNGEPLRLVHRDVSPANVMIGFDGGVKLFDFGIAKALAEVNEVKTQTGTLKGKLGYMAPELLDGRDFDHRSDLFSVGVLLHETLTGRRLFKGAHDLQTLQLIRQARVAPPSTVNPEVPPELDAICLRALARDPDERYQTGDELAAALDPIVHALGWTVERDAVLMRSLFPTDVAHTPTPTPQAATARRERVLVSSPSMPAATEPDLAPARRRTGAVVASLLGVALAVAGAGVAWMRYRAAQGTHEVVPSTASTSSSAASQPATPMAPPISTPLRRPIEVIIDSLPSGAEVVVDDGPPIGRTPQTLSLADAEARRTVVLRAPGYQPTTQVVTAALAPRIVFTLAPEVPHAVAEPRRHGASHRSAAPSSGRPEPAAPSPARSTEKPPGDVLKGDFVDPFGEGK